MTLRGAECLRRAEVVVLDALVDRRVLSHCSPGVKIIEAGKRGGGRVFLRQPAINRLLVRLAKAGKTVVRLKGGDPYFFGRGAEEAEALADQGISFEVVPGVSAVTSVPGFAGIPLTHRGHASVLTVVTGHEGRENPYLGESAGKAVRRRGPGVDWAKISPSGTLVILMGLKQLSAISRRLLDLGWPPALPAAAIQWGSWATQRTVRGTLADISWRVKQEGLGAPAVIVIGAVAGLGKKLDWFEKRPLFGKTILVTRARDQASVLTSLLEEAGARVIESPLIAISPLPLDKKGKEFLKKFSDYDGLLVTSANGAKFLAGHLKGRSCPPVYAIGVKTAAALKGEGIAVHRTAENFQSEGLVKVLGRNLQGKRFLLARAREGRDILSVALPRRGARVDLWPLYETRPLALAAEAKKALLSGEIDAVTFTSSSTVAAFMKNFTPRGRHRIFARTRAVSIGPITSQALRTQGVRPAQAKGAATIEDLSRAVVRALGPT
jgi:uroporphyrinogen III methyltransferase/synthase